MKTAQVKTTLGELHALLDEYLKESVGYMQYGSESTEVKTKWFVFKEYKDIPYENHWDYWFQCAQHFYPWTELRGVPEAFEMLSPETEVLVSSRVFGEMFRG